MIDQVTPPRLPSCGVFDWTNSLVSPARDLVYHFIREYHLVRWSLPQLAPEQPG